MEVAARISCWYRSGGKPYLLCLCLKFPLMLQRQQASAVIAAREKIVEGAVGMVKDALNQLEDADVVNLDNERRAAMVSNLLVVLCSDSQATPVVNTGTLYN